MDQYTTGQAPNTPAVAKLPALSKNSKVHKRPISRGRVSCRGGAPLSPKQPIIYVGTNSPFMGIVNKVRHALDHPAGTQSTKSLPLQERMAALNKPSSIVEARPDGDEILLRGTGRAMGSVLHVAAWFGRQADCRVSVRTMSVEAVDDVVGEDGDDGAEEEEEGGFAAEEGTRVRGVSCVEVGVSLRIGG